MFKGLIIAKKQALRKLFSYIKKNISLEITLPNETGS